MNTNYNTSPVLWESLRKHIRLTGKKNQVLIVINGHVTLGAEVIGRFTDNKEAIAILANAGWTEVHEEKEITFIP